MKTVIFICLISLGVSSLALADNLNVYCGANSQDFSVDSAEISLVIADGARKTTYQNGVKIKGYVTSARKKNDKLNAYDFVALNPKEAKKAIADQTYSSIEFVGVARSQSCNENGGGKALYVQNNGIAGRLVLKELKCVCERD